MMDHIDQHLRPGMTNVLSADMKGTKPLDNLLDTSSESAGSFYHGDDGFDVNSKRYRRRFVIFLAVLVTIAIGLGLGIGLALRAHSQPQAGGIASDMSSLPSQSGANTSITHSNPSFVSGSSSTVADPSPQTSYTTTTNSSTFISLSLSSTVTTSSISATPPESSKASALMNTTLSSNIWTSEPPLETAYVHTPAVTQLPQPPMPTSQAQTYWTQTQVAYSDLESMSTSSAPAASIATPRILPPYADLHHGDVTFYTPGLGACGRYNNKADDIVAVSAAAFDAAARAAGNANPNLNPLCGRRIRVFLNPENSQQTTYVDVTIVDRCEGCGYNDVDLSPGAFGQLAGAAVGRVHGSWFFL